MADDRRYTTSQLVEMLQRCNIRPSVQRVAVLSYVANGSKHPAAEEIYASLSQTFYSLSRTTVYNSLHILAEKGLVRELEIESGCIRYDMAPQPPHSHFVCRNCGRIADMPMPEGIAAIIMQEYSVDCVDVFLKGFCPDCRKLKSQPITNISTI